MIECVCAVGLIVGEGPVFTFIAQFLLILGVGPVFTFILQFLNYWLSGFIRCKIFLHYHLFIIFSSESFVISISYRFFCFFCVCVFLLFRLKEEGDGRGGGINCTCINDDRKLRNRRLLLTFKQKLRNTSSL